MTSVAHDIQHSLKHCKCPQIPASFFGCFLPSASHLPISLHDCVPLVCLAKISLETDTSQCWMTRACHMYREVRASAQRLLLIWDYITRILCVTLFAQGKARVATSTLHCWPADMQGRYYADFPAHRTARACVFVRMRSSMCTCACGAARPPRMNITHVRMRSCTPSANEYAVRIHAELHALRE